MRVFDPGFFDQVGANWSPDGSHVTFAAGRLSTGRDKTALYVEKANGTELRQITPSVLGATSARWSPNGRLIAFTSCCGAPEAWVVHPNGTGLREVTSPMNGSFSLAPVWSPTARSSFQQSHRELARPDEPMDRKRRRLRTLEAGGYSGPDQLLVGDHTA